MSVRKTLQSAFAAVMLVPAHELYTALLGPIDALIKDKRHLLVVPSGSLTSLPFHLLVTEKPAATVPKLTDIAT